MTSQPRFFVTQPWYQRQGFQLFALALLPLIWGMMLWKEGWRSALMQAPTCIVLPVVLLAVDRRRTPTCLERRGEDLLIHSPIHGVGRHQTVMPIASAGLEWIGSDLVMRNLAGEGMRDCLLEVRLGRGTHAEAAAAWLQAQGVRSPVGR